MTNHATFITGASSGIGRALAIEIARRGTDRIGLFARRAEKLREVADEVRAAGAKEVEIYPCDVADRAAYTDALKKAEEELGPCGVLVNNAGAGHRAFVEDTPEEHIPEVFGANVFALWHGASVVLPGMIERGSGHIVTVSSIAGAMPFPGNALYVAAKHAAVGFNRALRTELVGTGVDASLVMPAGVMTDWATKTIGGSLLPLFEYEGKRGAEIAEEEGITPPEMPPLLSPEEVASSIADLLATPRPELWTHPGSKEMAEMYSRDQREMEERLSPFWRAHREFGMKNEEFRKRRGKEGMASGPGNAPLSSF